MNLFKLSPEQEEKRKNTVYALDLTIKLMQHEHLTKEEKRWLDKYFIKMGVKK